MKYLLVIFFLATIQLAQSKHHVRNVCRDVLIPQAKRLLAKCKSKPEKKRKSFCCKKAAGFRKGLSKLPSRKSKKCEEYLPIIEEALEKMDEICDE